MSDSQHPDNAPTSTEARGLVARIMSREATVAVVGQGFVGVPEAMAIVHAGYRVVGVDRDVARVGQLNRGRSPIPDASDEQLSGAIAAGRYHATTNENALRDSAVVVLCVPTPLTPDRHPDLSKVRQAVEAVTRHLGQAKLIVLESTVPPGTTRSVVLPLLSSGGRSVGRDFFLGFAPERLDPGSRRFTSANTPRLISGVTADCRALTETFYRSVVERVKVVAAPEIAELAKAMENTFRFLNISFANEMAILCDRLGYSVWDVIDAAATKPFAFLPHFPGPGVGGSCIPVVPHYLRQVADDVGVSARLVETAAEINASMPHFVVAKLGRLLAARGTALAGSRILLLGVSYKPDVADIRESPAIPIFRLLRAAPAEVLFHDPLVPRITVDGVSLVSVSLTDQAIADVDAVVVLTLHASIDRQRLLAHARFIFDTRNALGAAGHANVAVL